MKTEVLRYAVRPVNKHERVTVRGFTVWQVLSNDTWGKCVGEYANKREAKTACGKLNDILTIRSLGIKEF